MKPAKSIPRILNLLADCSRKSVTGVTRFGDEMAATFPTERRRRGLSLYGSGVPLPEKRSRSISNVSLRILALLFCSEQLILKCGERRAHRFGVPIRRRARPCPLGCGARSQPACLRHG